MNDHYIIKAKTPTGFDGVSKQKLDSLVFAGLVKLIKVQ